MMRKRGELIIRAARPVAAVSIGDDSGDSEAHGHPVEHFGKENGGGILSGLANGNRLCFGLHLSLRFNV